MAQSIVWGGGIDILVLFQNEFHIQTKKVLSCTATYKLILMAADERINILARRMFIIERLPY